MATPADTDAILAAEEQIRAEQRKFPLISDAVEIQKSMLIAQIEGNGVFMAKAAALSSPPEGSGKPQFDKIRFVRRDGSCFVRSAALSLFEIMLRAPKQAEALRVRLDSLKGSLESFFGEFVLDFYEVVSDLLDAIAAGRVGSVSSLIAALTGEESEHIVTYFRYLISTWLRKNRETFEIFIQASMGLPLTVEEFCSQEVEAIGKECDQIHIVAFCQATASSIAIEYLDNSQTPTTVRHEFGPEDGTAAVVDATLATALLYRPGHYDILYLKR